MELAGLLVEFEVDELVLACHAGDVMMPDEVDPDEPAPGLVGLEGVDSLLGPEDRVCVIAGADIQ